MGNGVNRAIILGHLGRDPVIRYTASGTAVANLSVATNRQYKDRNGEKKSETEWHRITAWARLAEICGEYLRKGSQVYIEGRLQTRKWQDQNGQDRYTTEVVANEMQMLGGGQGGDQQPQAQPSQQQGQPPQGGGGQPPSPHGPPEQGGGGGGQPDFDQDLESDIPFASACFGMEWMVS